nr:radical SAM protein [uncultured Draconibacterium sp.]
MKITQSKIVWIPLTYQCNNKCSWCYAPTTLSHSFDKVLTEKKEDEFLRLLKDLKTKKIVLIGGEPTLYKNIINFISKIIAQGIGVGMVSNGRLLSNYEFTKKLYDSGLSTVTVSIEGSNNLIHDEITQVKGSFSESIKGIENAIKCGITTSTETVISKQNINDLFNIVDLFENYSLKRSAFSICGPCISDLKSTNDALTLNEGADIYQKIYRYSKTKKLKLITATPLCSFDSNFIDEIHKNRVASIGCHILFGHNFVLDANGDILPCVHFSNFPIFNIYEKGEIMNAHRFLDLYNDKNENNQKFRTSLKRYPSPKCKDGDCWNPCMGGCPIFWLKDNPEKIIKGFEKTTANNV